MKTDRIHLTLERIRKISAPEGKQAIHVFDDDPKQLAVRITPAGAKSFVYSGKLNGIRIRCTIGSVDAWTLEDARAEARRLQTLVDKGEDPRELERAKREAKEAAKQEREAIRQEQEIAKTYTLAALFNDYAAHLEKQGKAGSARCARSQFKHCPAAIAGKPAKAITPEEIADLLRGIREQGKVRTAGSLRSYLLACYNVAQRARFDPALPVAFKAYGVASNPVQPIPAIAANAGDRVLTEEELKAYLAALGSSQTDNALRLALLAGGQRMEQLLRAEVKDWSASTKTLRLEDAKGRRKQARPHYLPLAPKAAALVASLAEAAKEREDKRLLPLVATTAGKRAKAISKAMGGPAFDLRDLRRTVETMLAAMGISKDTRAQLLSHGLSGVQDKHYDRHSYAEEKRAALVAWEARLEEIQTGQKPGNVVKMTRKKKSA